MRVSLIVAMSRNGVIGRDGDLPWRLPDDLKHFKALTLGKPCVMGRKTFASIGRPLPGRTNIVMTRSPTFTHEGVTVAGTLEAALQAAGDAEEIMVCGGADIYALFLPRATRIYLTDVACEIEGDARFPEFDRDAWKETRSEVHAQDARHDHAFTFRVLERV